MDVTNRPDLADLIADFDLFDDWEDRYRHLIDLGKALPALQETDKTEANRVSGCASQVWLVVDPAQDGRFQFRGDSDAHIVRGLVALLTQIYHDRPTAEVVAMDAAVVLDRIGLAEHLTAQRANGLKSMIARIKDEAAAAIA